MLGKNAHAEWAIFGLAPPAAGARDTLGLGSEVHQAQLFAGVALGY
jgi:hypothetical protein